MLKRMFQVIIGFLLFSYVVASWYFSGLVIWGGVSGYESSEEAEILAGTSMEGTAMRESVTFKSGELTLVGSYYDNPADKECAVILIHGRGGNRSETAHFMPIFWDLGCDLLAYDIRGSGLSSEAPQTFGYYDRLDASAAIDWMILRTGLGQEQIGLFGMSYGSAVALETAAIRDGIPFVVADSTFSSLYSIVNEQGTDMFSPWVQAFVPGGLLVAGFRARFNPFDMSPARAAAQTETPILLIHGDQDPVNHYENSVRVFEHSDPERTELYITDWGEGHWQSVILDPEQYNRFVVSFLEEQAPQFTD